MLPFALRCMHALLPHRMGNPSLTIDHLCALLAMCREKVGATGWHSAPRTEYDILSSAK